MFGGLGGGIDMHEAARHVGVFSKGVSQPHNSLAQLQSIHCET